MADKVVGQIPMTAESSNVLDELASDGTCDMTEDDSVPVVTLEETPEKSGCGSDQSVCAVSDDCVQNQSGPQESLGDSVIALDQMPKKSVFEPDGMRGEAEGKTDGDGGKVEEREGSSVVLADMITIDTTADNCPEEGDVPEVAQAREDTEMPDGISIETEVITLDDEGDVRKSLDTVPSYSNDFKGVLTDKEFSMITGKPIPVNDARPRKTCFNCLGDHNVTDCPSPPDLARIAANRKKHLSTRTSNIRYHEDVENKYGQYQPGRLSSALRHALGLRGNEVPLFIYRMRVLGYPPGWLREAEVHQADVKMYDKHGKSVTHPDEEDGEIEPSTVKYRPEKLVSYPGFNVPLSHGIRDDCRLYDLPPMQHHHQRSEFERYMNMNRAQAYRKRKLRDDTEKTSNPIFSPVRLDMDVDNEEVRPTPIEFNPPLPDEPLPPAPPEDVPPPPPPPPLPPSPPPPPPPPSPPPPCKRSHSPEEGEITDEDSQSQDDIVNETSNIGTDSSKISSEENTQDSEDLTQEEESNFKQHHRSHSKGFKLGAHIPESSTPYTTLPDSEKWTVDVSDHINFENLPDALGTWDKMKGLMDRVKRDMAVLHADEDE